MHNYSDASKKRKGEQQELVIASLHHVLKNGKLSGLK